MEDIDSGLAALVQEIRNRRIRSIGIPPLGSGLGGLNWADVRPRIEAALRGIGDLNVIIFEPTGTPAVTKSREGPRMTPGRAALVVLIHPFGLELLATVHWVATRENAIDVDDAVAKAYAWNDRKKCFSPEQIGIAFETLQANGWFAAR